MPEPRNTHPHEPAFHRPATLWPPNPWIRWAYHGFFMPGHTSYQFFRFCLIGGIGVVVNAAIMYLAYDLFAVNYIVSSIMAFFVASINNFTLNKIFTFHDKQCGLFSICKQYLKFLSVTLVGLAINLGVLVALVELTGLYPVVSNLAGVLVATVSNFLGNKLFAFKTEVS